MRTYMTSFICGILLLFIHNSIAGDFSTYGLKATIENASIVARIHLLEKDKISSVTDSSKICGYRFRAKITENLKGSMTDEVIFFSKTDKDLLIDRQDYLLVAFKYTDNRKFFSVNGNVCDPREVTFFVRSIDQSLFPTDGDDFLVIDRISPFTPDNFIENKNPYISGYFIESDRIYAMAPLKPILDAIREYTKEKK